jgi:hypothetical protein
LRAPVYRPRVLRLLVLALAPALAAQDDARTALARAAWRTREVAAGVTWRQAQVATLFGGPQHLSVLRVDLRDGDVKLRVSAPARGLVPTSVLAHEHAAVAAVNGGFFAKDGTADDLLVIDGVMRRAAGARAGAALVVGDDGVTLADTMRVADRLRAADGKVHPIRSALAAGPWLLRAAQIVCKPESPRHPRTAVGLGDGQLVLLTVDGRTPPAFGMTLRELAATMAALGCRDAFNLDGGGSTTMWIHSLGGVVNCPCDDKVFDAAGERAVSNAVLVLGRPIWTLDEEEAALSPADAFTRHETAACTDGDCAVSATGGSAVFALQAVRARRVLVEVWTRAGDVLEWTLGTAAGKVQARRTGWCALDEVAWQTGTRSELTLRSGATFAVDAVRVSALHD